MKVKFTNPSQVSHLQLSKLVSKDELRPAFCAVCIDLKEKCIVGTDGIMIVKYPIEISESDTDQERFIVPLRYFNYLRYMNDSVKKDNIDLLEFVLTEDEAEVYFMNELVFKTRYVQDVKYPDWANVFPKENEKESLPEIGLSMPILKRLSDVLPKTQSNHWRFSFSGKRKGVLVTSADNASNVSALVMPVELPNQS